MSLATADCHNGPTGQMSQHCRRTGRRKRAVCLHYGWSIILLMMAILMTLLKNVQSSSRTCMNTRRRMEARLLGTILQEVLR